MSCMNCKDLEKRILELEKIVFNKQCDCDTDIFLKCDICHNLYCNNCVLIRCSGCEKYICINCTRHAFSIHGIHIDKQYCAQCYDNNILNKKCKCGKTMNVKLDFTCICGKDFKQVFEGT